MTKLLFLLKRRPNANPEQQTPIGLSTGLYNSASFMHDMMTDQHIASEMVVVDDYNHIDREVTRVRPTHAIIEALWVVPYKFAELQRLHPTVTWVVRLHSDMPFLAGEGISMDWLGDYSGFKNVVIAANSPRMQREMQLYLSVRNGWNGRTAAERVIYLPNSYPSDYKWKWFMQDPAHLDIGCFGAVRPLKNHLTQAFGAIEFANRIGKKLRFHINSGRVEGRGDAVMRNLTALFEQLNKQGHELVNHEWTPRAQFLELCASMDLGLQVSLSETFNIVGADLISQGVPVVGSTEIPWAVKMFAADPTSSADIAHKLLLTYELPVINTWLHQRKLRSYCTHSQKQWAKYFHTGNSK